MIKVKDKLKQKKGNSDQTIADVLESDSNFNNDLVVMVTIDSPLKIPLLAHIWDSNMKENQSDVMKIFTCFYSDAVLTPVELQM